MATVIEKKQHAFEAAKAAGQVPFKSPTSARPSSAVRR